MGRQAVGFCKRCGEKTRHTVLECHDNMATRVFETMITLGFATLDKRKYECECQKCGRIHTLKV